MRRATSGRPTRRSGLAARRMRPRSSSCATTAETVALSTRDLGKLGLRAVRMVSKGVKDAGYIEVANQRPLMRDSLDAA